VSTFPESPFRQRLMVQRATADGSVGLMNNLLTVRAGGTERRQELDTRAELNHRP